MKKRGIFMKENIKQEMQCTVLKQELASDNTILSRRRRKKD